MVSHRFSQKGMDGFVLFAFLLFTANKPNSSVRFLGESMLANLIFGFIWHIASTKNLKSTLPDNPVYRFLKLTGIQIAFLLRCNAHCIYVRKFLCLMEFGIPSFFKVRSVTPVEVLHPMRSMCYSRCTCKVLRTWVCTV